jgi:hypothetical protein
MMPKEMLSRGLLKKVSSDFWYSVDTQLPAIHCGRQVKKRVFIVRSGRTESKEIPLEHTVSAIRDNTGNDLTITNGSFNPVTLSASVWRWMDVSVQSENLLVESMQNIRRENSLQHFRYLTGF